MVGIGLVARLFTEVVAAHAAEASRREAAQLRAVNALAHAAAHEINNPLMAVIGDLALVSRSVPAGTDQARWIGTAREGAERIRDIVKRMNHITTIQEAPPQGALPPMLDIRKSSASTDSGAREAGALRGWPVLGAAWPGSIVTAGPSRKRRVASAGESAARMNEIAATPRAPASRTSLTRSGVMPPIAMTGMRSLARDRSRVARGLAAGRTAACSACRRRARR